MGTELHEFKKRRDPRHPVSLFALVNVDEEQPWHPAYISDISASGAFVKTSECPEIDAEISVRIPQLVIGSDAIITARVRHLISENDIFLKGLSAGLGVEFITVPEEIRQYLDVYMESIQSGESDPTLEEEIYQVILQARRSEVFGLLGLHEESGIDELVDRYQRWSKRFRPNRFVGRVAASHLTAMNKLYTRVTNYTEWLLNQGVPELGNQAEVSETAEDAFPLIEISRLTEQPILAESMSISFDFDEESPSLDIEHTHLWHSEQQMLDYVRELVQHLTEINHFDLLGVPFDAGAEEIQSAYHWRLRQFHPDRYPELDSEDLERLMYVTKRLNDAFVTLRTPQRRRQYLEALQDLMENA